MIPKVAASEIGEAQTGMLASRGKDRNDPVRNLAEGFWKSPPERVKVPYAKEERRRAESGVPRYTRNLVGRNGDHPVRLNTTW